MDEFKSVNEFTIDYFFDRQDIFNIVINLNFINEKDIYVFSSQFLDGDSFTENLVKWFQDIHLCTNEINMITEILVNEAKNFLDNDDDDDDDDDELIFSSV